MSSILEILKTFTSFKYVPKRETIYKVLLSLLSTPDTKVQKNSLACMVKLRPVLQKY